MRRAMVMVGVAFVLAGCTMGYHPHGQGRSNDTFTYVSTSHEPKTITLVDTRTGEKMWSCSIPVGQQLVVRFLDDERSEERGYDVMRWRLMPAGTAWGTLDNTMNCPPNTARRLDMTLRRGPEFVVAEATPAAAPAPMPRGVTIVDVASGEAPKVTPNAPAPSVPAAKPVPAKVEPAKPVAPTPSEPPVKLPE